MQVIAVMMQILFVLNCVFHESSLPNVSSTLFSVPWSDGRFDSATCEPLTCELCLDRFPSAVVLGVARRKRPDRMQMIRKKNDGNLFEGMRLQFVANRFAEYCSCGLIAEQR